MSERNHGTVIIAEEYFNGDIILTDPCYIIPDDHRDDWQNCCYGDDMFCLGFKHYLCEMTLEGDWHCEVFLGTGSLVLFTIRFCHLNFYGNHKLYTTQIPATLHDGFLDSCWGGHYLPEDWERMQFVVQFVDFNGDFKTDFILYARDMIMVVKPAKNGKWEYIAFADCVGKFVYLPFTIFGKPKVWRFKTEYYDSGFVDWE